MPLTFDKAERDAALPLISLALAEDFGDRGDVTTQSLIPIEQQAEVQVVSRQTGILAGSPVAEMVFEQIDPSVKWRAQVQDGAQLQPGTVVATVAGSLRAILSGERSALNFLTHLSGVATLTRSFAAAAAGTKAMIFDTRKTLPGWRVLEKYAVRAGGGANHRMGLYDAVLIKDNHLAAWRNGAGSTVADAVLAAREAVGPDVVVEVEVDTLEQLRDAFAGTPDIVLLDNMNVEALNSAVALRDELAPQVLLEASGGVSLATVREIAETGINRISVGALTHSALALDLAFDWKM